MEEFSDGGSTPPASTKKKDICFQQMSFFLGSAAWAAPSSVIEMLGANEIAPVLRFCLRQNARTAQMRRPTVCPTGTYTGSMIKEDRSPKDGLPSFV